MTTTRRHARVLAQLHNGVTFAADTATVAAQQTNTDARTVSGLILPFGQVGHTNVGALTVNAGALTPPQDLKRLKLLAGHDRNSAVGYCTALDQRSDGIYATFRVAATPAGDAVLAEAGEGVRDAFSVEMDQIEVGSDGTLKAGMLTAVALLSVPAYADARVSQVVAQQAQQPAGPSGFPTAPSGFTSAFPAGMPGAPAATAAQGPDADTMYAALAAAHNGEATPDVLAALADIKYSATQISRQQTWAGELWSGVQYQRRIVPLLAKQPLKGMRIQGWRWTTKPEVNDYAGDKANVPTNTPAMEAVQATASRLAGAHDIDRAHIDFNDTEFFRSYYAAMTESYAMKSDARAAGYVLAAATASGAASTLIEALVMAVLAMPEDVTPTYALIGRQLLPQAFSLTKDELPGLLSLSLGLDGTGSVDGLTIRAHSTIPANAVVVGAKPALTYYELGETPVRVDAVDLVKGGVDHGVFGYTGHIVNHAAAIRRVDVGTPPAGS